MTTIYEEEVTCAVCGAKQTVQEMGSTSSFGPMDLDTRPPPLQRGTMEMWVHECVECGYVAPELEKAVTGDGQVVASADYRAELAQALGFCEAGLKIAELAEFVAKLLAFQRELVLARDVGGIRLRKWQRRRREARCAS